MSRQLHHIRLIIAALFLLIFSAILAEKTFHAHGHPPAELHGKVISIPQATGNCDLCEFQLAADTDLPPYTAVAFFQPPIFVSADCTQLFSDQEYLHAGTDRGPPSL